MLPSGPFILLEQCLLGKQPSKPSQPETLAGARAAADNGRLLAQFQPLLLSEDQRNIFRMDGEEGGVQRGKRMTGNNFEKMQLFTLSLTPRADVAAALLPS